MAHRGRLYPVAFRRDFNFFCDTSSISALPKTAFGQFYESLNPPHPIAGHGFYVDESAMPRVDTLEWLSDFQRAGNHSYRLRLQVAIHKVPDTLLKAIWLLDRSDIGLVASYFPSNGSYIDPIRIVSFEQSAPYTDLAVFPGGSPFFNFSWGAVGY